jgi:hypothetical protein
MGSLNNLYISQSYQGLLTFSTNSGSTSTLTQISDGTGQGLGLYLNNSGSASLNSNMYIGGNLTVSGAFDIEGAVVIRDNVFVTGSIYSSADISSSRMLAGEMTASNMTIAGTLNVYKINTTIESSSVIFSSGSNILGDSILDTQTLNGTIIMSGSSQLTGSLQVSADISSSTLNGMGNVASFVTKMQAATSSLFTSASLGLTTASVSINVLTFTKGDGTQFNLAVQPISFNSGSYTLTSSFNAYTQSANSRLSNLELTSHSINVYTAIMNLYTASNDTKWNTLQIVTQSLNAFTASQNNLNVTFATTGSNRFLGDQFITGAVFISGSAANDFNVIGGSIFSGSVRGQVFPLTITSQTASLDASLGNFFTLTLASGSSTRLTATNINPGETIGLRITQPNTGYGTLITDGTIRFPQLFPYFATPSGSAVDIISFQSYDTSVLYGVAVNTMR